jgi:hypothetical protein
VLGKLPAAVASLRMMIDGGLALDCTQVATDRAFDGVRAKPIFLALLAEASCS